MAEFLPLESADLSYMSFDNHITLCPYDKVINDGFDKDEVIPCWSLAALLEQLPYEVCDDDGNSFYLQINKENDIYQLTYTDPYEDFDVIETDRHEHFVDACYEMIIRLNELKML